jgi:hypothetical protein
MVCWHWCWSFLDIALMSVLPSTPTVTRISDISPHSKWLSGLLTHLPAFLSSAQFYMVPPDQLVFTPPSNQWLSPGVHSLHVELCLACPFQSCLPSTQFLNPNWTFPSRDAAHPLPSPSSCLHFSPLLKIQFKSLLCCMSSFRLRLFGADVLVLNFCGNISYNVYILFFWNRFDI